MKGNSMSAEANVGVVGLAAMGGSLARNLAHHGNKVAVFNRTYARTEKLMNEHGTEGEFFPAKTLEEFVDSLAKPRTAIIMVKAGEPTDAMINALADLMEPGDIIVDAGNAYFPDTIRREKEISARGLHFVGCGVSGGEEGALLGPSMMPGGSEESWKTLKPIFESIAAKAEGEPCVTHIGLNGAGHFVKMVHNGIEYSDMQLIAESYDLMRRGLGMTPAEIGDVFEEWNKTELDSYLIEITAEVLHQVDKKTGKPLVVVLMSSKPQVMPACVIGTNGVIVDESTADGVSAFMWAPNPGMKGGQAIAEIILGETEPSGRLPITFPRHAGQLPVYYNQIRGQHGNRYADLTQDPAFAFGEGLGYTTFEYGEPTITNVPASGTFATTDTVHAEVALTNTGERKGTEVVQVYIGDIVTSYSWTDRELKAFQRVELEPGKSKTVAFDIPVSDCTIVDSEANRIVEPGEFEVLIGHSSRREHLKRTTFTVA